jgi:DNA-binding Lrp family transcriptional regulator
MTGSVREGPEKTDLSELDDLDRRILQAYLLDARLSFRELGHKLGVPTTTVQSLTSELEKRESSEDIQDLRSRKIGYQLTAITEVAVAKGKLLELEREVAMPFVERTNTQIALTTVKEDFRLI